MMRESGRQNIYIFKGAVSEFGCSKDSFHVIVGELGCVGGGGPDEGKGAKF